jgi:hypothetical protein
MLLARSVCGHSISVSGAVLLIFLEDKLICADDGRWERSAVRVTLRMFSRAMAWCMGNA